MSYRIIIPPAAEKDLNNLPTRLLDALENTHFPRIAGNPRADARPKSGRLAGIWGYDFGPRGGYRILYEILDDTRQVLLIAIGPHDQAYRRAARRR